jgi:hypothetical protein
MSYEILKFNCGRFMDFRREMNYVSVQCWQYDIHGDIYQWYVIKGDCENLPFIVVIKKQPRRGKYDVEVKFAGVDEIYKETIQGESEAEKGAISTLREKRKKYKTPAGDDEEDVRNDAKKDEEYFTDLMKTEMIHRYSIDDYPNIDEYNSSYPYGRGRIGNREISRHKILRSFPSINTWRVLDVVLEHIMDISA